MNSLTEMDLCVEGYAVWVGESHPPNRRLYTRRRRCNKGKQGERVSVGGGGRVDVWVSGWVLRFVDTGWSRLVDVGGRGGGVRLSWIGMDTVG